MLGKSIIWDNFSFQLSLRRYFPQMGPFYPISSVGRGMGQKAIPFCSLQKGKYSFPFSQKQVKTAVSGSPTFSSLITGK